MMPHSPFAGLGRFLIVLGVAIVVVGIIVAALDRFGLPGHLPGDFVISGKRWTLWVPLATSIILSVILTILLNLLRRH